MMVAGYDCLRDEGLAYAERLKEEGVETEVHAYQGVPHCFWMFPTHPKAVEFFDKTIKFISKYSG